MYKNKVFFFLLFNLLLLINLINGEDNGNIVNSNSILGNIDLNKLVGNMDAEQITKLLSENKLQEAIDLLKNLQKNAKNENKEEEKIDSQSNDNDSKNNIVYDFSTLYDKNDQQEMMKFYMYIQNTLNSKNETPEKKVVKSFLRKTIKKIKENENNKEKKSIEDIINNIDGYNLMLEKLVDIMKLDKEALTHPQTKKRLNDILVGMIKFVDYTNNNDVFKSLLDEIEIKKVEPEDGSLSSKFKVNINSNKTQLEMLKKASSFMGMDLDHEHLEKLTSNKKWYEDFINNILNNSDEL